MAPIYPYNETTWNVHDPLCSTAVVGGITERRLALLPARAVVGKWLTLTFMPLFFFSSLACVLLRREFPLSTRHVGLIVMGNLGSALVVLCGSTRDWFGWFSVNCDVFLWASYGWCVFQATPLFLRVYELRREVLVNQAIAGVRLENQGVDFDMLARVADAKGFSNVKVRILVPLVLTLFVAACCLYTSLSRSHFLRGCVGCFLDTHDIFAIAITMTSFSILCIREGWRVYRLDASQEELRSIVSTIASLTLMANITGVVSLVDFYATGALNPLNFILIGSLVDNWKQCVVPTWRAFKTFRNKRMRHVDQGHRGNDTVAAVAATNGQKNRKFVPLAEFLATKEGFKMFEDHINKEFSGEHLQFWYRVQQWKMRVAAFNIPDIVTKGEELKIAKDIYDAFVDPDGLLVVNVSDAERSQVAKYFSSGPMRRTSSIARGTSTVSPVPADEHALSIPIDVFGVVSDEVLRMMEKDNFARLRQTPQYNEFCANRFEGAAKMDLFA